MNQSREEAGSREVLRAEYYDTPTLVLHWTTALLVIVLFATSLVWNYVTPRDHYWRPLMESAHVGVGIVFGAVIFARLIWRFTGMRQLSAETGISGVISRCMYLVLYVLLVAEIVLGFVLRWRQGEEFEFFGLFSIAPLLAADPSAAAFYEQWHNWVGWAIVLLSVGHAAAALLHHFVLKDQVLRRMLHRHRQSSDKMRA